MYWLDVISMNPIDLLVVRSIKMGEMGELLATFTGYRPGSLRIADVSRIVVYIEGISINTTFKFRYLMIDSSIGELFKLCISRPA